MKKLIPFDIDLAKKGARVVTETGQEVEILNYNLGGAGLDGYVLGRYRPDFEEDDYVYEIWPASGKFADPVGRPPELRIERDLYTYGLEFEAEVLGNKENEDLKARNRELEIINDNLRLDRERLLAIIKRYQRDELKA